MKKINFLLSFVIIATLFTGCGKENTEQTVPTDNGVEIQQEQIQKVEIKAAELSGEISKMTEVTSYVGDTDGDGTDETVVLATSAERNNKGEFLWNDGQSWALYVSDKEDGAYVLFDGFVQAGNVNFEVSDYYMKDGAVPKISVIVSTGAGFTLKNYVFSADSKAYVEEVIYDTKNVTEAGINRRFSSISGM